MDQVCDIFFSSQISGNSLLVTKKLTHASFVVSRPLHKNSTMRWTPNWRRSEQPISVLSVFTPSVIRGILTRTFRISFIKSLFTHKSNKFQQKQRLSTFLQWKAPQCDSLNAGPFNYPGGWSSRANLSPRESALTKTNRRVCYDNPIHNNSSSKAANYESSPSQTVGGLRIFCAWLPSDIRQHANPPLFRAGHSNFAGYSWKSRWRHAVGPSIRPAG